MKQQILVTLSLIFSVYHTSAQNNVGIGTNTPDASAILEMSSNNQGVLVPRLTTAQRLAVLTPANGLLVFDTDISCFFFYSSVIPGWQNLCNTAPVNGVNCWDLNGNLVNDPAEDINGDGLFNSVDCQGPVGPQGPQGPQGLQGPQGAQGIQGPPGVGGNNTSAAYNPNGSFSVTDGFGTVTSSNQAWLVGGNNAPSSNNLGQIGNSPLVFITNNQDRMSIQPNGDIFVAGSKPIMIRRYSCNNCDDPNRNTGMSTNDWVAFLAGFYPTNSTNTDARSVRGVVYANTGTNTWHFKGDLQNPSNESWSVDIIFIKRQMVDDQRPTDSWSSGGIGF